MLFNLYLIRQPQQPVIVEMADSSIPASVLDKEEHNCPDNKKYNSALDLSCGLAKVNKVTGFGISKLDLAGLTSTLWLCYG